MDKESALTTAGGTELILEHYHENYGYWYKL